MEAFLFHGGLDPEAKNPPVQWQNYILMKDIFHCTPSELKAQKPADIAAVLTCMEVEARVAKIKSGPALPLVDPE